MTTDGMRSICSLTEKTTESLCRLRLEDRIIGIGATLCARARQEAASPATETLYLKLQSAA